MCAYTAESEIYSTLPPFRWQRLYQGNLENRLPKRVRLPENPVSCRIGRISVLRGAMGTRLARKNLRLVFFCFFLTVIYGLKLRISLFVLD